MKKHDKYGVVEYNKAYIFTLFLAILTAIAVTVGGLIYLAEAGGDGSNINTLDDAIWTSWMASSTVGFGDHFPKTWGGRSGVIFMSLIGSGFTGIIVGLVAVTVTRRFDNSITNRQNKLLIDILIQKMDRMERHLGVDETAEYIPDEMISINEHAMLGQDDSGLYIIVNRKRGQVTTHEELETANAHFEAILTNRGVL
ncbi:potassium voltage-gated channel subfamily Amember 1 protein [Vibrio phage VCPH]|nr:potassium voltage-gated channel subfamily Amember 1 protein [Vibrio phage VCPH]